MRRLRLLINALLFLVPICVLGVGAYRFVRRVFSYLNTDARLAGTASAEATRALGRRVVIGDVKIDSSPFGLFGASRIVLKNIFVADSPTDDKTAFVRAGSVTVAYSLRQLLTGTPRTALVEEIHIVRPEAMLARDPHGLWNFTQLLKPQHGGGRPFADRIAFTDGTVIYNDQAFPHPPNVPARPLHTRLDHLSGILHIRPDKSVAFDISGIATPDIVKQFHVTGMLDPATLRSTVHVAANQLSLAFFSGRFLSPSVGSITSGFANLDVTALYAPVNATSPNTLDPNALDAHGAVQFSNVTVHVPQAAAPLEGLKGAVSLVGESALTDVTGRFAGADFHLNGSAFNLLHRVRHNNRTTWELAKPTLAVKGSLRNADFVRFARLLHYERYLPKLPQVAAVLAKSRAVGDVDFQVVGPLNDPTATLNTRMAAVQYDTFRAEAVDTQLLYAHRIVDSDVRARYAGGDVVLRARVSLDKPGTYQVQGHGKNLHLARLGIDLHDTVSGTGRVDFTMRGILGQTPNITAQAEILDAGLHGQTIHSVYARAETVGQKLVLRTLRAEDTKGFALANGSLDLKTQRLNINVEADELDIGAFAQAFPLPLTYPPGKKPNPANAESQPFPIDGIGYLRANIGGTLTAPQLRGQLSAFALQTDKKDANSLLANKAEVAFTLNRDVLHITQGTVERYPGLLTFSGDVHGVFDGTPALHLTFRTDQKNRLSVADLLQVAKIETPGFLLAGTLTTNDLVLEGDSNNLRINAPFTARIEDAAINGVPVGNVFLTATFDGTKLHLLKIGADIAEGTITASGTVGKDGKLDLEVSGSHIVLDKLQQTLPDVLLDNVTGTANVEAHIGGSITDPVADARRVEVLGLAYNGYTAGDVRGSVRYADKTLFAQNFTLTDAVTNRAVLVVPDLTYHLEQKSVRTDSPIRLDAVPIARVRDLIRSLPAPQKDPSAPPTSFGQTELGRIAAQYMSKMEGALSGTLRVAGTVDDPRADVTVSSADIRLNDYVITELSGQATLTKSTAVGSGGRVVLRRLLPAPPSGTNADNPDSTLTLGRFAVDYRGAIDADLTANNLDADLLKGFLPSAQGLDVSGTVDYLSVIASGKTASPNLEVSLNLRNIGYHGETLDRVDISHAEIRGATLANGKVAQTGFIRVNDVQVEKRDPNSKEIRKYTAHAGGSITGFQWQAPFLPDDAKLDLTASFGPQDATDNNLRVISLFAPNVLPPTVEGTLTLNAAVQGTRAAPRLTGGLTVTAPKFQFGSFATGLKDLRATLAFHDDHIEVTEFAGHTQVYDTQGREIKKGGVGSNIALTGSLPLGVGGVQDPTGMHLFVDQAVFDETALPGLKGAKAHGIARLNLDIIGSILDPTLSGTVSVHDTQASLPTEFGGLEGAGVALPVAPRFNLSILLDDKTVRLVNPQLNVRAGGYITIKGSLPKPQPVLPPTGLKTPPVAVTEPRSSPDDLNITGRITLAEGVLTLPTARFKILPPGVLSLNYPVYDAGQPSFSLNVEGLKAQTSLTATSLGGVRKRYKVTVNVSGPLSGSTGNLFATRSGLRLMFETDPDDLALGQAALTQRLAGALIGVDNINQFGQNPAQAFASTLTNVLTSSYLPGAFDRVAAGLGFEEFAINYDPVQRLTLSISRHLYGPLYVSYFRTLENTQEKYDLKLSFRFRERYQLSFDLDEQHTQRYLLEGVWRF